jgi:hypothetical protein
LSYSLLKIEITQHNLPLKLISPKSEIQNFFFIKIDLEFRQIYILIKINIISVESVIPAKNHHSSQNRYADLSFFRDSSFTKLILVGTTLESCVISFFFLENLIISAEIKFIILAEITYLILKL